MQQIVKIYELQIHLVAGRCTDYRAGLCFVCGIASFKRFLFKFIGVLPPAANATETDIHLHCAAKPVHLLLITTGRLQGLMEDA